ncbi:hypothetical protein DIJ97_19480 [Salmonella enterica]|nr:hypothetical protein [Salmonella enterica]
MITGKQHIISEQLVTNLSESFSSMNKNLDDEINRPYPFAYALTMLGEVGHINKIFEPSTHYGEQSASAWIINNISYVRGDNNNRLYMLSNALINLMLRMRGDKFPAPKVYSDFTFPLHCR